MSENEVTCTGRDGIQRTFIVRHEKCAWKDEWTFRVYATPTLISGEFFELSLKVISGDMAKIIAIHNNGEDAYKAKGIPEALLPFASKVTDKKIVSSSTNDEDGYRTPDATKMWERLCRKGLAEKDEDNDRFLFIYEN